MSVLNRRIIGKGGSVPGFVVAQHLFGDPLPRVPQIDNEWLRKICDLPLCFADMWIRVAAAFGFLGVALGAFGAHALRGKVSDAHLSAWQTGVLYHLLHAVVLLALGLYARATDTKVDVPASLFAAGIVLFAGSLYALTLTGIGKLGMITPFGGLSFLAGWVALFVVLGRRPA